MAAVKFYLLFGILSWAIFNIVIIQTMKRQRRPDVQSTNENSGKLTKAHTNGLVKPLAEQ